MLRVWAEYERDIEFLDAGAGAGACCGCGPCGSDCGERSQELILTAGDYEEKRETRDYELAFKASS